METQKISNPITTTPNSYNLFLLVFFLVIVISPIKNFATAENATSAFNVGVILDLNRAVSDDNQSMTRSCISIALSDFYAAHSFYKTRLVLHIRDSDNNNVGAASAAVDLLKNAEVQAIIGPETSTQANFVVDLGNQVQVPVICFSATSPFLTSSRTPYFVRTSPNDLSQVKAITSIVQNFLWKEIIPIYEDTEYGNGILSYLSGAFQEIDVQIPFRTAISPFATDREILDELNKLIKMQTRVFIVHMNPRLGSRLFNMAKEAGMMSEGYSWIITDGISNLLELMDSSTIESMQGVLGVRPYIPKSNKLNSLKTRLRRKTLEGNTIAQRIEPTICEVLAYDTVWALAIAAEKVGATKYAFLKPKIRTNFTDLITSGVSQLGPKLLEAILRTKFKGLSGEFRLINGQLQTSVYQILNVIGNDGREIGFWTPTHGLSRELSIANSSVYSTPNSSLRAVVWPGESTNVPKGWAVPNKKPLRVGVPFKGGFGEFVKVDWDENMKATVTGYSIDVFNSVMTALPYKVLYEFIPYVTPDYIASGNYDNLVNQVYVHNFDVVVGDVTISPNRSLYADFTLPYTQTGVSMIVRIEDDKKNGWVFLKPLSTELWMITGAVPLERAK